MRAQGSGTVVNIGSEAGLQASAKAGAAYVISKFGLTGFTQTINAEERPNGIRALTATWALSTPESRHVLLNSTAARGGVYLVISSKLSGIFDLMGNGGEAKSAGQTSVTR